MSKRATLILSFVAISAWLLFLTFVLVSLHAINRTDERIACLRSGQSTCMRPDMAERFMRWLVTEDAP